MHEDQVRALLERLIAATDPAAEYEERHQDYLVEFPQSGEQMNRDGLRKLQEHYPAAPRRSTCARLTGAGDVWFGESTNYPDGKIAHGVTRIEFRDGKMWRETRYWAEPFQAPAWRSAFVGPIQEPVAG
jgi:hypothetical protein